MKTTQDWIKLFKQLQHKNRYLALLKPRQFRLNESSTNKIAILNRTLPNIFFSFETPSLSLMSTVNKTSKLGFQQNLWNVKSTTTLINSKDWNYANLYKPFSNLVLQPQPFIEKNELNRPTSSNTLLRVKMYRAFLSKTFKKRQFGWTPIIPLHEITTNNVYLHFLNTESLKADLKPNHAPGNNTLEFTYESSYQELENSLLDSTLDNDLQVLGKAANPFFYEPIAHLPRENTPIFEQTQTSIIKSRNLRTLRFFTETDTVVHPLSTLKLWTLLILNMCLNGCT